MLWITNHKSRVNKFYNKSQLVRIGFRWQHEATRASNGGWRRIQESCREWQLLIKCLDTNLMKLVSRQIFKATANLERLVSLLSIICCLDSFRTAMDLEEPEYKVKIENEFQIFSTYNRILFAISKLSRMISWDVGIGKVQSRLCTVIGILNDSFEFLRIKIYYWLVKDCQNEVTTFQ